MKKHFLFLLIIFINLPSVNWARSFEQVSKLQSFETDFCTMFPEGTFERPFLWGNCCLYHDLKYWIGGTESEQHASDLKLKNCVLKASNEFYAQIIYQGVRLGHYSPVKSRYRWGWGWGLDIQDSFFSLRPWQLDRAKELIINENIEPKIKDRFIKEYLTY